MSAVMSPTPTQMLDGIQFHSLLGETTTISWLRPRRRLRCSAAAVSYTHLDVYKRQIVYYPLALGRNFDELLRIVKGLQVADAFNVALPADWQPGERVIVPPAGSCGTAKDRMAGADAGVECEDWFFCTKELPLEEIQERIHRR